MFLSTTEYHSKSLRPSFQWIYEQASRQAGCGYWDRVRGEDRAREVGMREGGIARHAGALLVGWDGRVVMVGRGRAFARWLEEYIERCKRDVLCGWRRPEVLISPQLFMPWDMIFMSHHLFFRSLFLYRTPRFCWCLFWYCPQFHLVGNVEVVLWFVHTISYIFNSELLCNYSGATLHYFWL